MKNVCKKYFLCVWNRLPQEKVVGKVPSRLAFWDMSAAKFAIRHIKVQVRGVRIRPARGWHPALCAGKCWMMKVPVWATSLEVELGARLWGAHAQLLAMVDLKGRNVGHVFPHILKDRRTWGFGLRGIEVPHWGICPKAFSPNDNLLGHDVPGSAARGREELVQLVLDSGIHGSRPGGQVAPDYFTFAGFLN